MKKIVVISVLIGLTLSLFAQKEGFISEMDYQSEVYGGFMFHTNGWGLSINKTRRIEDNKKWLFSADLITMTHPKEAKRLNPYIDNTKRYVYGKLNYLTVFRPSIGRQKVIYNKGKKRGVQVAYSYNIGVAVGLTRPVYLEIAYPSILGRPEGSTPSTEIYNPQIHNPDMILGRASYFKGFDKTNVYAGLHGKLGLSFEYASADNLVRSIETGLAVDVYFKQVPLMAFAHNQRVFLTGYLSFYFGKKQ
ncbi:MAG: hypothetical protein JKY42_08885 [Flavobacteriales bacterium]|nr:hypothetical protein [Flavobacteriales bacterium]